MKSRSTLFDLFSKTEALSRCNWHEHANGSSMMSSLDNDEMGNAPPIKQFDRLSGLLSTSIVSTSMLTSLIWNDRKLNYSLTISKIVFPLGVCSSFVRLTCPPLSCLFFFVTPLTNSSRTVKSVWWCLLRWFNEKKTKEMSSKEEKTTTMSEPRATRNR